MIGVLTHLPESNPEMQAYLRVLRQELDKLGWAEGRSARIIMRFSNGADRLPELAKELFTAHPEVIVVHAPPATEVLHRESRGIPVVFVAVSDPIGQGFVASLARPGGNLTGLLTFESGIVGKWLAMLKEIVPRLERAALVANPKTTNWDYFLRAAIAAAPSLGIEILPRPITNATDIERTIATFAGAPTSGMLLLPDGTNNANRDLIVALTARHRVPAVYPFRFFVKAGGLMSYGVDQVDLYRQAATYVDRILRGAKPADLPVQVPTKYETVLNLNTAKVIGIDVPPSLLVRADEVIE